MQFLWPSCLKGQPWKHEFVSAGETARCRMSEEDEPQSPPQQTAGSNLTLLPNVSIIVCLPDGHLCENTWLIPLFQSPVLSPSIRNHHCHLIFRTLPFFSCSTWAPLPRCLWLIHRKGNWEGPSPFNSRAPTENCNQTKISQPSFNIRTNDAGAPAPAPAPQSYAPQRIQSWTQKFMSFEDNKNNKRDISWVLTFGLHEWDWETGRVSTATWIFPLCNNRKNYNTREWHLILTHCRCSDACTRSQWCWCRGTTCKRAAVLGEGWSQPPEGTGNLCKVLRFILLFSWLLGKRKNYNSRLLRQIITRYSKNVKNGWKGKDPQKHHYKSHHTFIIWLS